jgi:hypothetical protein
MCKSNAYGGGGTVLIRILGGGGYVLYRVCRDMKGEGGEGEGRESSVQILCIYESAVQYEVVQTPAKDSPLHSPHSRRQMEQSQEEEDSTPRGTDFLDTIGHRPFRRSWYRHPAFAKHF